MLYLDAGPGNDETVAGSASKEGGAGESGLFVGKTVLMVGCGIDGLVYTAAVISLAGHG